MTRPTAVHVRLPSTPSRLIVRGTACNVLHDPTLPRLHRGAYAVGLTSGRVSVRTCVLCRNVTNRCSYVNSETNMCLHGLTHSRTL
jgi:hypothetical protein